MYDSHPAERKVFSGQCHWGPSPELLARVRTHCLRHGSVCLVWWWERQFCLWWKPRASRDRGHFLGIKHVDLGYDRPHRFHSDHTICFWGGSVVKNLPANAGDARDMGLITRLGRSPGGGNGNSLQYFCLENPHGQRNLVGYSPYWSREESNTIEWLALSFFKAEWLSYS